MKRKILALFVTLLTISSICFASNNSTLQGAIQKYKNGNYTGCIQDLEFYTRSEQSNALAFYYLAIANVQAGRKANAIQSYDKVLALRPNSTLLEYATKGKICLEQPEFCYKNTTIVEEETDLDKFIKDKKQFVYKGVQTESSKKNLDSLKNRINSDEEINRFEFQEYEKSSNNNQKPSNEQIVAAIKILNQAGLSSMTMPQQNQANFMQQSPYNDISMMLGNGNNSNNNTNSFMNMLPFLLAQNNQNGGKPNISPEVLQAMMMNSMMPDFNFSNNNNDKN